MKIVGETMAKECPARKDGVVLSDMFSCSSYHAAPRIDEITLDHPGCYIWRTPNHPSVNDFYAELHKLCGLTMRVSLTGKV